MNERVIGLEWNPKFPDLRLIDEDGIPLSISHAELCEHPLWRDIRKEGAGTHVPTTYYKFQDLNTEGIWRIWMSSQPLSGFAQVPSFIGRAGCPLSRVQYAVVHYRYEIEFTVWNMDREVKRSRRTQSPDNPRSTPRPQIAEALAAL